MSHKDREFPTGFVLTAFFISRCIVRSPAVAIQGHPYYGKDAEIGKGVAKIVPLR